jgi:hypothetical protein
MRLPILFLAALAAAAPAVASAQAPIEDIDNGSFLIYRGDRAIGAETFGIEGRADSVNAGSHSYLKTPTPNGGEEMVEKGMALTVSRSDYGLRYYQSNETIRGETIITGVVAGDQDTAITVFRERKDGGGLATRLVAPPGRLYVMDSGLYTLIDVICLNQRGKAFASRPISVLTLASAGRDTVIEVELTDLGTETIRWGSRPVVARKLQIKDRGVALIAWLNPSSKLLRLTHEASGLRVEREAPAVKKQAKPAPKPGG